MPRRASLLVVTGGLVILGVWGLMSSDFQRSQPSGHLWGSTNAEAEKYVPGDLQVEHEPSCTGEDLNGFETTCAWSGIVGGDEIRVVSAAREGDREASTDPGRAGS
jgi:hypothetical protein